MIRRARRFLRKASLAGSLTAVMLIVCSGAASAHSYFIQSDPADGSILERAPQKVVLMFSSAVAPNFTNVDLIEARGAHYAPTSVVAYAGKPNIVVVNLPEIPNGSYRLTFATRDSVDLHQTAGTIVFGVGEAPPAMAAIPKPAPIQLSEVVLRWLALVGIAGALGGVSVALLVIGRLPVSPPARARVQRAVFGLALVGTGLVLAGETGLLAVQASSLGPVVPSIGRMLAGSEFGVRWLVTILLVAGLAALLLSLWVSSRRREVPGLLREIRSLGGWALLTTQFRAVLLCVGLTAAVAFSGHVAGASGTSVGGVALLTVHVASMAVWAGGVAALTLTLLALRRSTGRLDRACVMALVVGFGPIAAVSFATLMVSGLLLSGMQVASVTALLSTQYGALLIAKVGLIGILAIFGLRHALWTWRALARHSLTHKRFPSRLPMTIGLEAAGALAVVLLASALGASAPAQGPQFDPPSTGQTTTQLTREQDGLLITISVKPNVAGPNLVSVVLVNTRRPAPAPVQRVMVLVQRPGGILGGQLLATTRSGSAYDAGSVKLIAGDARFTVRVERTGLADSLAAVPWQVAAVPMARAPVVVSSQRLAPIVDLLALLAVIATAVLITAGVVRHSRAARPTTADADGAHPERRRLHVNQSDSDGDITPFGPSVALAGGIRQYGENG